jgi:hypothetical protein
LGIYFPRFGILHQEKSGNPAWQSASERGCKPFFRASDFKVRNDANQFLSNAKLLLASKYKNMKKMWQRKRGKKSG